MSPEPESKTEIIKDLQERIDEMEKKRKRRPRTGVALSTVGIGILLGALGFDAMAHHITLWLWLLVGTLFMISGYFVRDPNKALVLGGAVVSWFQTTAGAVAVFVPFARRKGDPPPTPVVIPIIPDTPSQEFIAPKPKIIPKGPPKADEG